MRRPAVGLSPRVHLAGVEGDELRRLGGEGAAVAPHVGVAGGRHGKRELLEKVTTGHIEVGPADHAGRVGALEALPAALNVYAELPHAGANDLQRSMHGGQVSGLAEQHGRVLIAHRGDDPARDVDGLPGGRRRRRGHRRRERKSTCRKHRAGDG